ncbi:MAG: hypothetical protein JKY48_10520 [Flavobacteriales bacterium]|nr:hypothetical protein [Flavobacteriales bacterium]
MGFFDRLFKGVVVEGKSGEQELKELLLRESIVSSKIFLADFEKWIDQKMHIGLLTHLKENYEAKKINSIAQVNHFVHESPNSNGFYFRAESPWDAQDYSFLIQLFIVKLKKQSYVLKNTLREVFEENEELTTKEEFYLKPSLKYRKEIPYQQLFGNVSIEHQLKGLNTVLVKIIVNTYSDRNYKAAYDFEDFINELFLL